MRSTATKPILLWSPRLLAMGFVLFLSRFSIDAFFSVHPLAEKFQLLLIHLLPALLLLFALMLAWRWQWIGTLLFGGFAVWYLTMAWGIFPLSVYLVIVGPAILIATLYTISWLESKKIQLQ